MKSRISLFEIQLAFHAAADNARTVNSYFFHSAGLFLTNRCSAFGSTLAAEISVPITISENLCKFNSQTIHLDNSKKVPYNTQDFDVSSELNKRPFDAL